MKYPYKHWGLLALRLSTGIVFVYHGWGKLTDNPGIQNFTAMVSQIGFPLPGFFAWLVALIEFVGGILLIAGVFVQYTTVLLAIVMLVALISVKKFQLPLADPDIALLGSLIALFTLGSGKYIVGKAEPHECKDECKNGCKDGGCKVKEEPGAPATHEHEHTRGHHETHSS